MSGVVAADAFCGAVDGGVAVLLFGGSRVGLSGLRCRGGEGCDFGDFVAREEAAAFAGAAAGGVGHGTTGKVVLAGVGAASTWR